MKIKYVSLWHIVYFRLEHWTLLFDLDLRPEKKAKTSPYSHFSYDDLVPNYNRLKPNSIKPSSYLFSNTLKNYHSRLLFFPIHRKI